MFASYVYDIVYGNINVTVCINIVLDYYYLTLCSWTKTKIYAQLFRLLSRQKSGHPIYCKFQ